MKLVWWQRSLQNKYSQLLATLIVLFFVGPIWEGKIGQIIISVVFLVTILTIIRTFNLNKRFFFLLLILAGTSSVLDIYTKLQTDLGQEKLIYTDNNGNLLPICLCCNRHDQSNHLFGEKSQRGYD